MIPTVRIFDPKDYLNLLPELLISSGNVLVQVSDFALEFPSERNQKVEYEMHLPMFATSFYFFVSTYKRMPTQDEFRRCYYYVNKKYFEQNPIDKKDISGLDARIKRTYPSLVRDLFFCKLVYEDLRDYDVRYNLDLDIVEGIDLMISRGNRHWAFNLFTATRKASDARGKKEYRHEKFSNVTYVEFPVNFKKSLNVGNFFLYGKSELNALKQELIIHGLSEAPNNGSYVADDFSLEDQYTKCLPLMNIRAACGSFLDNDEPEIEQWIDVSNLPGKLVKPGRFIVRAEGHSMEPLINSGELCIFDSKFGGSKEGLCVLAEIYDRSVPSSERFTIKKYHSTKDIDEEGRVFKTKITLSPINKIGYDPIELYQDEEDPPVRIAGVFITALNIKD